MTQDNYDTPELPYEDDEEAELTAEGFIKALSYDEISDLIREDINDYAECEDYEVVNGAYNKLSELTENVNIYFETPIDFVLEQMAEFNETMVALLNARQEKIDMFRNRLSVMAKALEQYETELKHAKYTSREERRRADNAAGRANTYWYELHKIPRWIRMLFNVSIC